MMGKHRAESQQRESWQTDQIDEMQSAPPAPPPAPAPVAQAPPSSGAISDSGVERLKELAQLHEQGVLTDDEFAQQKARLLAG
jgi:hypothetical protein